MPFEVRTLAEWEGPAFLMLSVVIPANNEEGHIAETVQGLALLPQATEWLRLRLRLTLCARRSHYQNPKPKLVLNRLANFLIRTIFLLRYNDVTNAFKLYRRSAIAGIQPLLSHHFNLTVEQPLKCIIRGYSYAIFRIRGRTARRAFPNCVSRRWGHAISSSSFIAGWSACCRAATIATRALTGKANCRCGTVEP